MIKSLGPGHWLLGSAVGPPSVYPAFNGQTLLIQPVQQRGQQQAVVQSGTMPPASVPASTEDPWLHGDPWQSYRAAQGMTTGPKPAPSASAREVVGPTEKRFQEQDSRLAALERTISEVQTQQETFRAEVQKNRAADMQSVTQQMSDLGATMSKVQQDLAKQQTSYASLATAQAQKQAQLQSGMDELIKQRRKCLDRRPPGVPKVRGETYLGVARFFLGYGIIGLVPIPRA